MKKLTKTPILLLATTSLLTSCSSNGMAGTYGFQMGKDSGTHFAISVKMSNKYVTLKDQPEVTKKYKGCEMIFSVKTGDDDGVSINSFLEMLAEILGQDKDKPIRIPGYYYKGEKKFRDGSFEVKLGVDTTFIEDLDDEDVLPIFTPDMVEKIVYTTYLKDTLTLNIPVSITDVAYQLYWYGADIIYTEADGVQIVDSPSGEHEPGTHPTVEEVEEINLTFGDRHAELMTFLNKHGFDIDLSVYRDYYTLALGLLRK